MDLQRKHFCLQVQNFFTLTKLFYAYNYIWHWFDPIESQVLTSEMQFIREFMELWSPGEMDK